MNHIRLKYNTNPVTSLVKLATLFPILVLLSSALIACQPQTNKEEQNYVELVPVNPEDANQNTANTQDTVVVQNTSKTIQSNTQSNPNNQNTGTQANSQPKNQEAGQAFDNTSNNTLAQPNNPKQNPAVNNQAMPQPQNNNNANSLSGYGSQGIQITKVEYKNQAGQSMRATFKTSAVGNLEAQVSLPDGIRQINLVAPQAGGNNPIYESDDGSVVLVSHAGGGSIDLIVNGEPMEFDAISADAEVVTGQY